MKFVISNNIDKSLKLYFVHMSSPYRARIFLSDSVDFIYSAIDRKQIKHIIKVVNISDKTLKFTNAPFTTAYMDIVLSCNKGLIGYCDFHMDDNKEFPDILLVDQPIEIFSVRI